MKVLSKAAKNYLSDVFGTKSVKALDKQTIHAMLENVEMGDVGLDKEISEAYFDINALKKMTADQFYARMC